MTQPYTWRLSLDGVPIAQNTFTISPGQTFNVNTSGLHGTLTMDVLDPSNTVIATGSTTCQVTPPPPPPAFNVGGNCTRRGLGVFTISDVGGDMPTPFTWRIDRRRNRSVVPIAQGSFQIHAGQSTSVNTRGQYGTLSLSVLDTSNTTVASGSIVCQAPDDRDNRRH